MPDGPVLQKAILNFEPVKDYVVVIGEVTIGNIVFKADDTEKLKFGIYMPNYNAMQESKIQRIRMSAKQKSSKIQKARNEKMFYL